MAYMHQIRFRLGSAPDPPLRELAVLPRPPSKINNDVIVDEQ